MSKALSIIGIVVGAAILGPVAGYAFAEAAAFLGASAGVAAVVGTAGLGR